VLNIMKIYKKEIIFLLKTGLPIIINGSL